MSKTTVVDTEYDASSLEHLTIREQVRRRPGMWISNSSTKGLHHLISEIVDNSVDEFLAGHGSEIDVTVTEDNWVTVRDYARGIPVDEHKSGVSGLELVLTTVGGGGKYGGEESGYKVSGGLHGAGSSVVNFVSKEMKATVRRDGYEWHQSYKTGIPDAPIKKGKKSKETGTEISFLFDTEIFGEKIKFEREIVERRLRELAYLNPGLKINLTFHSHKETFFSKNGLFDMVKQQVEDRDSVKGVHKTPVLLTGSVTGIREDGDKEVEDTTFIDIALYWTDSQNENSNSFTNSINNPEGGTHYDGFRKGLRKALNEAADGLGKLRVKDQPFEQSDTREGLFAAIAIKVSEPQFEGQVKGKLNNPEVEKRVSDFVAAELKSWLMAKENKAQAEMIVSRVIEARDGRLAARKAKNAVSSDRKGLLGSGGLPGKLADCTTRDRDKTEIFLVEGDSAGGSMKNARLRSIQAVLPLRGKIKNAEKAQEATLDSIPVKDILSAIGGSITTVKVPVKKGNKTVNRSKLIVDTSKPRYNSIIIATDADVDGGHIATLLLTFFYRYTPDLLRGGHVYIADMPLFRIEHKKNGRTWVYSEEELQDHIKKDAIKKRSNGELAINRFKGLGEMNESEIKETALDHKTRRLRRVVIDDNTDAEDITTLLMGSRVARRREFIEENALNVDADV